MQQDKQPKICPECQHENPKQFMTQEYISHAPGCSLATPPEKRDWRDRFDEKFNNVIRAEEDERGFMKPKPPSDCRHELKDFIAQEIRKGQEDVLREVRGISEMQVGNWNPEFVEKIGIENIKLQDASNEGWNNCLKLVKELLGIDITTNDTDK